MNPEQIVQGKVYFSIHGVPYRVNRRMDGTVVASCANDRGQMAFEMSVECFAESMARTNRPNQSSNPQEKA